MKVQLLFADRDPAVNLRLPARADDLVRDLGLTSLLDTMSGGDIDLRTQLAPTVLAPLADPAAISYRQDVLADFLALPALADTLYRLSLHAVDSPRRSRTWLFGKDPSSVLRRSRDILGELLIDLHELRTLADSHLARCSSAGLRAFFADIQAELPDDYLSLVEDHLHRLQFPTGVTMTAQLGLSGQGSGYVLRKPESIRRTWRQRVHLGDPDSYTYRLPDRDEAGARALMDLEAIGINLVADALAQSVDHIRSFFALLQFETAFYSGCVRLDRELEARRLPRCRPVPQPADELALTAHGLYEVNLGIKLGAQVVTNDLLADGADLIMITGTNQGGKSTTLRALGLAQLLMQCGATVPARDYRSSVASTVLTHYRREEDATMASGKFDEELARMSALIEQLSPGALVLLNESFAATNEREGSMIARHIVDGLRSAGIRVAYVTHLYELAAGLYHLDCQLDQGTDAGSRSHAVFLRPERGTDTERTFRVVPGEPLATSFGPDLYRRVFGADEFSTPLAQRDAEPMAAQQDPVPAQKGA